MGVSWGFVVLLVYPALQVPMLWVVVRYCGLRNDDGPRDPVGYSMADGSGHTQARRERHAGHCARCRVENDPVARYCHNCLTVLRR